MRMDIVIVCMIIFILIIIEILIVKNANKKKYLTLLGKYEILLNFVQQLAVIGKYSDSSLSNMIEEVPSHKGAFVEAYVILNSRLTLKKIGEFNGRNSD